MADAKLVSPDNGPYIVTGTFGLVDSQGKKFSVEGEVRLCRCR